MKWKNLMFLLVTGFAIPSVSASDLVRPGKPLHHQQPVKKKKGEGADAAIVDYFSKNIEQPLSNPDNSFYAIGVRDKEVSAQKKYVWDLWKRANEKRMATFSLPADSTTDITWDLPAAEKMPVQLLRKKQMPEGGYPFFINLHGGGRDTKATSAWGGTMNSREWFAAKFLATRYEDAPSLYFIPRMADDRKGRWYFMPQQVAWIRAWQLAVLTGSVNPDKTYILGISEGGYGSFRMGTFFADYFAGIGPMAGAETNKTAAIENLRNTAIRVETGEADSGFGRNVWAHDWKRRLDSAAASNPGQFNHVCSIQINKGHGIDYYKVAPWLVQQTRKNYPDTLSFLYYNQDNVYRTGFGYVRLDGLSKSGEREFKIIKNGNHFNIITRNREGNVQGDIELYVDKVNFKKPVKVSLNGKLVISRKLEQGLGVMMESIALFGDPQRIFRAKVKVPVQ